MAYRAAAPPLATEQTPATLAYAPMVRRRMSGLAAVQIVVMPIAVAALVGFVYPNAGLAALLLGLGMLVWWWRRPAAPAATLTVEDGTLHVLRGKDVATFKLESLLDVALDTKTIRPVSDGGSAIPAMRFIDPTIGPEIDTARIVLVTRKRKLVLTEDYASHMDSSAWAAKIRVFLRKNSWVPADERE